MLDRPVPQNNDAEMALLGALLIGSEGQEWTFDDIRSIVGPRSFLDFEKHGTIFRVVGEMYDKSERIDLVTFQTSLEKNGQLEKIGGIPYLMHLAESIPAFQSAPLYAREVRRCWQLRELIRSTEKAGQAAYHPQADVQDIIANHSVALERISDATAVDREPVVEADVLRSLVNPRNTTDQVIPVALGHLGRTLDGGFDRGSLAIVGGRPSTGKTSLGLGLCVHLSRATDGCPSLFVSNEMSIPMIAQRLLSMRSGLPMRGIRSGEIEDGTWGSEQNRVAIAAQQGHTVYLLDQTPDVHRIAGYIRRAVKRHGVGLTVVDYLGLLKISGNYERIDLRLGAISKLFKHVVIETSSVVVLLVQLSRAADAPGARPRMSHLKNSGDLEADADVIILIQPGKERDKAMCETTLIVDKNRQGNTGDAAVFYQRSTMTYLATASCDERDGTVVDPEPVGAVVPF